MTISKKFQAMVAGVAVLAGGGLVTGCSDATKAAYNNLGQPAKVKLYSGGKLIYEGVSTGKINNEDHSDGYYFNDECIPGSNKLVEVAGQIVISRDNLNCPKVREPVYQQMQSQP